jgi:hypothetical protein
MVTWIGIVVFVLGLVAWAGQSLSFFAPALATRLGVLEPKGDIDPSLRIIEAKAEGLMDLLLAWTLPASALLMLLDHPLWPYLGIFGGGVFLYFSGLITFSRIFITAAGRNAGSAASKNAAYLFSVLWAASSVAMISLAAVHLSA